MAFWSIELNLWNIKNILHQSSPQSVNNMKWTNSKYRNDVILKLSLCLAKYRAMKTSCT
jgi:hypothetical protein